MTFEGEWFLNMLVGTNAVLANGSRSQDSRKGRRRKKDDSARTGEKEVVESYDLSKPTIAGQR